jgi:hypothetical protein
MTIKNPEYARKKMIPEIRKQMGPPTLGELRIINKFREGRRRWRNMTDSQRKLAHAGALGYNPYTR